MKRYLLELGCLGLMAAIGLALIALADAMREAGF
jgi:hypothetical protein